MGSIIERLFRSAEPSIRYKILVGVLGEGIDSCGIKALQEEIRSSSRVSALLAERGVDGTLPHHVYKKWNGAHWVLATLADIGYPPGDATLAPLVEQTCACWLSAKHVDTVRVLQGRARRCASQEGNTLYAMLTLGFSDDRADLLAENLLRWQWPDGGWNCDKNPDASVSSFHESWIPLRALTLYGRIRNHAGALAAANRAVELFLSRRLFRRLRGGNIIKSDFLKLMYPPYWHYGILNGLKVMAEAGMIQDARCSEALDMLESKRLPDGSFPAEACHYSTATSRTTGYSRVTWGPQRAGEMNEWVTAEALFVLHAACRVVVPDDLPQ